MDSLQHTFSVLRVGAYLDEYLTSSDAAIIVDYLNRILYFAECMVF